MLFPYVRLSAGQQGTTKICVSENKEKVGKGDLIIGFLWWRLENMLLSVMKRRHVFLEVKSFEKEAIWIMEQRNTLSAFNFLIFTQCPVD